MKFVLNKCSGGFNLSETAINKLKSKLNLKGSFFDWEIGRNNNTLIETIEKLGSKANGAYSRLVVVTIPDEATDYEMLEYDGIEIIIYVLDGKLHHA